MTQNLEYIRVAECLYRNLKSSTYYVFVKRSGKQIRRSLKTKDRKLAERKLAEFRKQINRVYNSSGEDKNITFSELSDRWLKISNNGHKAKTDERRRTSINQLVAYFGILPIRSISLNQCEDWQIKRGSNISASTFNKERDALVGVLDIGVRDGILLDNPAQNLKRRKLPKNQIIIPNKSQYDQLVKTLIEGGTITKNATDLVELLATSGMRLGEATSIKWIDVDFEKKLFTVTGGVTGTKNNEARTVPLFPAMESLLNRIIQSYDAIESNSRIIKIDNAKKALITACKNAQLPHFTHHCMRHYFVSNAIEKGIDFKTIASWIGHKDGGILVAKTYGHLRDLHSQEMAKLM